MWIRCRRRRFGWRLTANWWGCATSVLLPRFLGGTTRWPPGSLTTPRSTRIVPARVSRSLRRSSANSPERSPDRPPIKTTIRSDPRLGRFSGRDHLQLDRESGAIQQQPAPDLRIGLTPLRSCPPCGKATLNPATNSSPTHSSPPSALSPSTRCSATAAGLSLVLGARVGLIFVVLSGRPIIASVSGEGACALLRLSCVPTEWSRTKPTDSATVRR